MNAETIIDNILRAEGSKYTNDPNDSGGATRFGVTQAVLARYRGRAVTAADVAALTEQEAREIYWNRYIVEPGFNAILQISPAIAAEVIDTGVNCGQARAAEMLQRALNAFNRQEKDYPDVRVDGACGPGTISALKAFLSTRKTDGEKVLLRALNCLQGEFYIALAERRPKDEAFAFGWLLNRVS